MSDESSGLLAISGFAFKSSEGDPTRISAIGISLPIDPSLGKGYEYERLWAYKAAWKNQWKRELE